MNYYERHLGDWSKDTAGLSMLEEGAYNRLIDAYYAQEHGIEHDRRYLVARAMSPAERKAVDAVLLRYFRREGVRWVKGRVEEEIAKAQARIERARENGTRGGRPSKAKANPEGTQQKPSGLSVGSENGTQNGTQEKALHTPSIHQVTTTVATHTPLASTDARGVCDDVPPVQVGQFEGHMDPPPKPIQATPAVIAAVALRKLGYLDIHGHHPGLCDALGEGVTQDHLLAIGERYAGTGKPGSYVITAARREHAERGSTPVGGTHGTGLNGGSSLLDRVAEDNAALDAIDPDLLRIDRQDFDHDGGLVDA